MKKRKYIWIIIAVLLCVGIGYWWWYCLPRTFMQRTLKNAMGIELCDLNLKDIDIVDENGRPNGDGHCIITFTYYADITALSENIKPLPVKEHLWSYYIDHRIDDTINAIDRGYYAYKQLNDTLTDFVIIVFDCDNNSGVFYVNVM